MLWKTIHNHPLESDLLGRMFTLEDVLITVLTTYTFENCAPSTELFAILILKPNEYMIQITSSSHMHILVQSLSISLR